MRKILINILMMCLLCIIAGCSSIKKIENTDHQEIKKDTVYIAKVDHQQIKDSIFVKVANDTIYIDRWHWRNVVKTDTIFKKQIQYVEKEVVKKKITERKVVPTWCWWSLVGSLVGWLILILVCKFRKTFLNQ